MDLKSMLERRGWRVIGPVASVTAAALLLERERPSVALLDVNLGNELATPVAEQLRQPRYPVRCGERLRQARACRGRSSRRST
ncbi:hypothetical protein [Mesorhizobium sp.]|uniref:hypothetical protein n=1 Tax=Mesorhizobium sp. TaxID=1871066 RepID=UPI00345B47C7